MSKFDSYIERAKALGLPVWESTIPKNIENGKAKLPCLVYFTREYNRGHDLGNCLKETSVTFEFYTSRFDDPEMEKLIESNVLFDTDFEKSSDYIASENTNKVTYTFKILEKARFFKGE